MRLTLHPLLIATLLLAATCLVSPAHAQDAAIAPPGDDPEVIESASTKVPLAEIKRFVAVFNAVREAYVEPVGDDALMQ